MIKPQAPPRKRTNPMDSSPFKEVAISTAQKMVEKLNAPEQLAKAICDDWLALAALCVSSNAAPRR